MTQFGFEGAAVARDEGPWRVQGKLFGRQDEKAEDVSGIACATAVGFARPGLLVDDETQGAQVVIVEDGKIVAGEFITLIDDAYDGEPLELDGEGVAYADPCFYVIGSHGHPRDKDKKLDPVKDAAKIAASIKANSRVIRLRIDADATTGTLAAEADIKCSDKLAKLLAADPALQPFVNKRLDENGLTIEGLAVRERRLYAGLRGPLLNGKQAAIFSAAVGGLFGDEAPECALHVLSLGDGRGVRDLAAFGNDFLVLAGPAAETEGTYSIFCWDGGSSNKLLADLPKFPGKKGKQSKPEAILPLDRSAEGLRVLVFFDGLKEGAPRALRIPYP